MKKFKILYIDPPWEYEDKAQAGERGAGFKYEEMNDERIKAMDVASIADDDCVLFLWATWPRLELALEVMKAWGFKYKTVGFNWIKTNKVSTETIFWGMGNWTRSNSEICLMGIKGKPKRVGKGVHSVVEEAEILFEGFETENIKSPIMKHSAKPLIIRDKIVQLMGDVPRIELFARTIGVGWHAEGFEIDGRDINDAIKSVSLR